LRKRTHTLSFALLLLITGGFSPVLRSQTTTPQPASQELTLQAYIAQLHAASQVLEGGNPTAAKAYRRTLAGEWDVQVDGSRMKVATDWLDSALTVQSDVPVADQRRADRLRQSQQHLAALIESAEALAEQSQAPALAQSHAQIDRILSDREFQGSHEPSWLDKQKAKFFGWIDNLIGKIFRRMGVPARIGSVLAWTVVALAGVLLAFWFARWLIAAASRADMDLRGVRPAGHDWRHWAREAHEAAARGDYRMAIHAAYWSALTRLEENRLLPEDRSRTPRESLRLVQRTSAAYTPLAHLTKRFELTWYGYRTATSADWDDAMKELGNIECLPSSTATIANS
jgi:hypothetical protein